MRRMIGRADDLPEVIDSPRCIYVPPHTGCIEERIEVVHDSLIP